MWKKVELSGNPALNQYTFAKVICVTLLKFKYCNKNDRLDKFNFWVKKRIILGEYNTQFCKMGN
jgi:hypothetical protein